ncbi:MAG: signal peptide peptidase SppA [Fibrobacter sp.]|nr:signal peptide peptidase SppA [Fibrobacter sp.]
MKKIAASILFTFCSFSLAYLPGEWAFPSLPNSNGTFGNPAGLSAFDSPGAIFNFGRTRDDVYEMSLGANGDYLGASFEYRSDYENVDESRWNLISSIPILDRLAFVGISAGAFRSSAFDGTDFSMTPGVLVRPFNWLALGFDSRHAVQFGPEKQRRLQEYGATVRLWDGFSVSYAGVNKDVHRLLLQADLKLLNIGVQIPLHGEDDYRVYLSHAFGRSVQGTLAIDDDWKPRHFSIGYHSAKVADPNLLSRVVRVPLSMPLQETEQGFSLFGKTSLSLESLREHFELLLADGSAEVIIFDFTGYKAGTAISKEIERGIAKLSLQGRSTIAYLDEIRPTTLLAASSATKIVLEPSARVNYRGVGGEVLYYKGFFDWIGIKVELLRHGAYKSAVEPYTADSMSAEARSNYEELYKEWWNVLTADSRSRISNTGPLDSMLLHPSLLAQDAKRVGLVDTLLYLDEVAPYALKALYGVDAPYAMATDFAPKAGVRIFDEDWRPRSKIALLNIEGSIVDGAGGYDPITGRRSTGSAEVLDALGDLMRSPEYSALIVRINSPGGSAQASDEIWHRLRTISKTRMPVVASIGDMGASGGYYIACGANEIIAENASIVGSIGIFGGKVSLKGLLDKLKLRMEPVKTHVHADAEGQGRAFDDEEKAALQNYMDSFYDRFLGVVSEATHISKGELDAELAGGRVFTGSQGVRNGLVHRIGGMDLAIAEAKRLAGISERRPVELQSILTDDSYLSRSFTDQIRLLDWVNSVEKTQVWSLFVAPPLPF